MHLSDVLHLRDLAHECWQLADEFVDHHSAGVLRRISEELKEKATEFEIRFAGQLREKFTLDVDAPPFPRPRTIKPGRPPPDDVRPFC
jgi:hypothetical protein